MNAFNYETQTWVGGEAGRRLTIEQMTETLHTLRESGSEYLAFIGRTATRRNVLEAIVMCKRAIAQAGVTL